MTEAPVRVLFVFAWLVVGGEETELRLLARHLGAGYRLDVVACFRKPGMSEQSHEQLAALGVDVDRTPYDLSFEDTVAYLARKIPAYDIVVSCQDVADIYPALERLHWRPPLIEHGGLVKEALAGPKHFTTRYVGVCRTIRDAAASRMPDRPQHAREIPSMVELDAFRPEHRAEARALMGVAADAKLIGWVGRLDRKKRVEDFIAAAALVHAVDTAARFVIIGGADAFMPEYETALRAQAAASGLGDVLAFLGDRPDVPRLLAGLDVFVWLSRDEGMPHVVLEAGAAGVAVVATADNGTLQVIEDGVTGVFVPHEAPAEVAAAVEGLLADPGRAARLGAALQAKIRCDYGTETVIPQWRALFADVLAEREAVLHPAPSLFKSFFLGGFECSTHRRGDGRRLDLIAAIGHDADAAFDYRALAAHGVRAVRDGLRWHLIEQRAGQYDWASFLPMLRAAGATGTQVIWDLLHYGWPDDIDIWRPDFVRRFARFAGAAARVIRGETAEPAFYAPVNEISFLAWAGGDAGYLNPFARGRGHELKVQLCRAAIAAMEAILEADPGARFVHADPLINVICDPGRPWERGAAAGHHEAQFQAWDMIAGIAWPQLGGAPKFLDIIGANYYPANQWIHGGPPIDRAHPLHKPLRTLLRETYARYGRPIFLAETGTEGHARAGWLAYVSGEVRAAMGCGVPVQGICLYPVVDHPGWDDDRACPNGLLGSGKGREPCQDFACQLAKERVLFGAGVSGFRDHEIHGANQW